MNFDKKLPNHFFFNDWENPKSIKLLRPFVSERGSQKKDKIYHVWELEFDTHKVQICLDGENCWTKIC